MVKIWVSEADVYKAIERDCGYRGRQHITGWWYSGDDIAFDNNRKEWGAEHYTPVDFLAAMRRHIPEAKDAKCNNFGYDYQKDKRGLPQLGTGSFCFFRDNNKKEV